MARDKKTRIDTQGPVEGLGHNPFAALAGDDVPAKVIGDDTQRREAQAGHVGHRPRVARTRKGGWPLSLEKRPGGKVMTILRGVEGDLDRLLKVLRKQCGAGGVVKEDRIEIQGDHQVAIAAWLDEGMAGLKD